MSAADKQTLGKWGENAAAAYLQERGYAILERNVRTRYGEIDLVAQCDGVTVFIEVRTRSTRALGLPEISITKKKLAHMRSTAVFYIQQHANGYPLNVHHLPADHHEERRGRPRRSS